jgi:hypothetical protein
MFFNNRTRNQSEEYLNTLLGITVTRKV